MKIRQHSSIGAQALACAAFTMVEIALSIAIIGFALVAIIGVLPLGMQVKKDTRAETIINQDATYWLETLRNGNEGLDELTNYVQEIAFVHQTDPTKSFKTNPISGREIVGWLSYPGSTNFIIQAVIPAISGSVVEKSDVTRDLGFKYQLAIENKETFAMPPDMDPYLWTNMVSQLRELRLEFRWPVLANGSTGSGKQVFRTFISGRMEVDTNYVPFNLYFIRP